MQSKRTGNSHPIHHQPNEPSNHQETRRMVSCVFHLTECGIYLNESQTMKKKNVYKLVSFYSARKTKWLHETEAMRKLSKKCLKPRICIISVGSTPLNIRPPLASFARCARTVWQDKTSFSGEQHANCCSFADVCMRSGVLWCCILHTQRPELSIVAKRAKQTFGNKNLAFMRWMWMRYIYGLCILPFHSCYWMRCWTFIYIYIAKTSICAVCALWLVRVEAFRWNDLISRPGQDTTTNQQQRQSRTATTTKKKSCSEREESDWVEVEWMETAPQSTCKHT